MEERLGAVTNRTDMELWSACKVNLSWDGIFPFLSLAGGRGAQKSETGIGLYIYIYIFTRVCAQTFEERWTAENGMVMVPSQARSWRVCTSTSRNLSSAKTSTTISSNSWMLINSWPSTSSLQSKEFYISNMSKLFNKSWSEIYLKIDFFFKFLSLVADSKEST